MKFIYQLSLEGRKSAFVNDGSLADEQQEAYCSLESLSVSDREFLFNFSGILSEYRLKVPAWSDVMKCSHMEWFRSDTNYYGDGERLFYDWKQAYERAAQEADEKRDAYLLKQIEQLDVDPEYPPYEFHYAQFNGTPLENRAKQLYQIALANWEVRKAKQDAERAARAQAQAEAESERTCEMLAWAAERGSFRLNRLIKHNYDGLVEEYITERAAIEHPNYVIDMHKHADEEDIASPSDAALDEADRVGGRVVYVNHIWSGDTLISGQVVKIENYLGLGYNLYSDKF